MFYYLIFIIFKCDINSFDSHRFYDGAAKTNKNHHQQKTNRQHLKGTHESVVNGVCLFLYDRTHCAGVFKLKIL